MFSLDCPSDKKDTRFVPTRSTSTSTTTTKEDREDEMWEERKWVVNESNLMELFKRCQECGAVITKTKKYPQGASSKCSGNVKKDIRGQWKSCADVRGMPVFLYQQMFFSLEPRTLTLLNGLH